MPGENPEKASDVGGLISFIPPDAKYLSGKKVEAVLQRLMDLDPNDPKLAEKISLLQNEGRNVIKELLTAKEKERARSDRASKSEGTAKSIH